MSKSQRKGETETDQKVFKEVSENLPTLVKKKTHKNLQIQEAG